jgi:hypothetical protein
MERLASHESHPSRPAAETKLHLSLRMNDSKVGKSAEAQLAKQNGFLVDFARLDFAGLNRRQPVPTRVFDSFAALINSCRRQLARLAPWRSV